MTAYTSYLHQCKNNYWDDCNTTIIINGTALDGNVALPEAQFYFMTQINIHDAISHGYNA